MIVPYAHVIFLAGIVFLLGLYSVLMQRSLIMILLGLEIMLNASAIAFVGASLNTGQLDGQAMVIFILAVAAVEVAIGLVLIVCVYRQTATMDPRCIETERCEL